MLEKEKILIIRGNEYRPAIIAGIGGGRSRSIIGGGESGGGAR